MIIFVDAKAEGDQIVAELRRRDFCAKGTDDIELRAKFDATLKEFLAKDMHILVATKAAAQAID
ncbi:BZ3500_MvSof-1268-A1-R1_Chr11-3g03624 [Microbotryum saponariae]|uniref:BZ3500_MvSof-1268-A1-R1_Chr11-3g03624 protein n=1 Tax=Microbotryum saponariae TaxID=289078 RepID=A0A2X0KN06_9BASI|nr:BZ3500_MvSof-1268-A1-R1_Chr11-3g03624 [Microbotryum saponariae]SDA03638.1 BZ3501_MvSof-1269-A2-R1_Chr11g03201 [Microbotryum saponariae]